MHHVFAWTGEWETHPLNSLVPGHHCDTFSCIRPAIPRKIIGSHLKSFQVEISTSYALLARVSSRSSCRNAMRFDRCVDRRFATAKPDARDFASMAILRTHPCSQLAMKVSEPAWQCSHTPPPLQSPHHCRRPLSGSALLIHRFVPRAIFRVVLSAR